jgi:hypothetical protein
MRRICAFCGSSTGSRPEYRAAAEEMAAELVRRNIGLVYGVYGGGNVGLMGVLADAVLRAGGGELNARWLLPRLGILNLEAKNYRHDDHKLTRMCSILLRSR